MNPATPPAEQARPQVRASRLIGTLAGAGALAGLALMLVHHATKDAIAAHKAETLRRAVYEVLHDPDRYDTLCLHEGKLVKEENLPTGAESTEKVYLGFGQNGAPVGFAIAAGEPGFQDIVSVIFGYEPKSKRLLGMRVLGSKETPGLGDKIEKDMKFVGQFDTRVFKLVDGQPVIIGVKAGKGREPHEVDMITGATISSRAVIRIINNAVEKWEPLLLEYLG